MPVSPSRGEVTMGQSISSARQTPQASPGVFPRPKAQTVTEERARLTPDDSQVDTLVSALLLDIVRHVYGKVETGAGEVGKDRSNFTRDVRKLATLLEKLGPVVCAQFGAGLLREYGVAIETVEQRGSRVFDNIESGFKELRQLFAYALKPESDR